MITGAWSVIFYGRPRASHDIDFVVELSDKDVDQTLKAISQLSSDFMVQPEDIKEAVLKRNSFNIIHLPTMLKLDFWLSKDDSFDKSRFSRRKKVKILDQNMTISSAEDTIIQKLLWYKKSKIEKHLVDAAFVYKIQNKKIDLKYFDKWLKNLKLEQFFKELKKVKLEEYI